MSDLSIERLRELEDEARLALEAGPGEVAWLPGGDLLALVGEIKRHRRIPEQYIVDAGDESTSGGPTAS